MMAFVIFWSRPGILHRTSLQDGHPTPRDWIEHCGGWRSRNDLHEFDDWRDLYGQLIGLRPGGARHCSAARDRAGVVSVWVAASVGPCPVSNPTQLELLGYSASVARSALSFIFNSDTGRNSALAAGTLRAACRL